MFGVAIPSLSPTSTFSPRRYIHRFGMTPNLSVISTLEQLNLLQIPLEASSCRRPSPIPLSPVSNLIPFKSFNFYQAYYSALDSFSMTYIVYLLLVPILPLRFRGACSSWRSAFRGFLFFSTSSAFQCFYCSRALCLPRYHGLSPHSLRCSNIPDTFYTHFRFMQPMPHMPTSDYTGCIHNLIYYPRRSFAPRTLNMYHLNPSLFSIL